MLDSSLPMCVDLDGTLLRTDVTQESILVLLMQKPWMIFYLLFWVLSGRAYMKKRIAAFVSIDVSRLPINYKMLDIIDSYKKSANSKVYLVTAADYGIASDVAKGLGVFDGVFASDGVNNLRAEAKGNFLAHRFGENGFIYAGNSRDDLLVWRYAAKAIAVNAPLNVRAILKRMSMPVEFVKDGKFSFMYLGCVFSPMILMSSCLFLFAAGFVGAMSFLCMATFFRLLSHMKNLRIDKVVPLTELRINLTLGYISIPRAWSLMLIFLSGSAFFINKMIVGS